MILDILVSLSLIFFIIFVGIQFIKSMKYNIYNENISIYIVSLIIPLVGFIIRAINLTKDTEYKKSVGMHCVILGIISCIISYLILYK